MKSVFAAVVDVEGVVVVVAAAAVVESICQVVVVVVVVVVDVVFVDINYSIEHLEDFLFENQTIEENLSLDDQLWVAFVTNCVD